jgi:PilZ domain-containing protein
LGEADQLSSSVAPGDAAPPFDEPRGFARLDDAVEAAEPSAEETAWPGAATHDHDRRRPAPQSRESARLSFEAVVRIHCDGRRGIHTGFMRDISRGGMFLRLVDPEPVGKRLGFELFVPGWRMAARGIGEVAWQRPRYEGPGRPPGMALRFVALEAEAIAKLAKLLPEGEGPDVEVLAPRVPRWKPAERIGETAVVEAPVAEAPAMLMSEAPLAEAIAVEPMAEHPRPLEMAFVAAGEPFDDSLGEPMIFVPPPPLPVPPLIVEDVIVPMPEPAQPKQRWGAAAAGIAAFAGLATLVIVGAARREVVVVPAGVSGPPPAVAGAAAPGPVDSRPSPAPRVVEVPVTATADSASSAASLSAIAASREIAAARAGSALSGVRWEPLAGGGTRVVVALDGAITPDRVRASRITGDAPRLVVRLLGVSDRVRAPWEPATSEVRRIRSGRHDGDSGSEVHLVLDLGGDDVTLARSQVVGGELWLDLARNAQ